MLITKLDKINYITLFASGTCNLKCSYCYIHRNPALAEIDKEIRDAWEDGTYLTNVKDVFVRLGADVLSVKKLEFWGGESTLHLSVINKRVKDLFTLFPNVERIGFSSNFIANIDETTNFVKAVNRYISI